jgi:hypothetical protein
MQNYKPLSPKGGQGENKKFLTNPNKKFSSNFSYLLI